MVDGVIIIDERGIIQAVNPASCQLFGYTSAELLGQNVSLLMENPHKREHDGYIEHYKKTGEKKIIGIGREVEGRCKDGTTFPFRLSISESIIDDKRFFTGIVHDITEIKEAQNELLVINKQLEKIVSDRTNELTNTVNKLLTSNTRLKGEVNLRQKTEQDLEQALAKEKELGILKSQFVTMASHEFRTPLSTILSSASLIGKYVGSNHHEKRLKHVNRIKSAVKNMTNILEDILSLGKMEEGKVNCKPQSIELHQFIPELVNRFQALLKPGQQISFQMDPTELTVEWDTKLIEQILNNLLSNASKYSDEGSTIHVSIEQDEDHVITTIRDEGIGIPLEEQKHLFDRFFRASNAINIKGTGLGLHIVHGYVLLMNGSIDFKSEEHMGTTITIHLPQQIKTN